MLPLTASKRVICTYILLVFCRAAPDTGSICIGSHAALLSIIRIPASLNVHQDQIKRCHRRIIDHTAIRRLAFLRHTLPELLRSLHQCVHRIPDALSLPKVTGMIDCWRHRLGMPCRVPFRKTIQQHKQRLFVLWVQAAAKLLFNPCLRIGFRLIRLAVGLIIIRQIHKIAQRILGALHVPHIDNPKFAHAVLVCLRHLLPRLCQARRVLPLITDR